MTLRKVRWTRAFTLTELMIVVAIIGILATVAVVSFRKMIKRSHYAEATRMVNSIRVAQESYHAEAGVYSNISTDLDGKLCPTRAATAEGTKMPWDPTCSGGVATWQNLPVHTDGPVLFSYATVAGRAGTKLPAAPSGMSSTPNFGGAPTADWYLISAKADIDKNGTFGTVVGVSWTNDIYVDNEGE